MAGFRLLLEYSVPTGRRAIHRKQTEPVWHLYSQVGGLGWLSAKPMQPKPKLRWLKSRRAPLRRAFLMNNTNAERKCSAAKSYQHD